MGRPSRETILTNQLNKRVEVWGVVEVENELGEIEFKNQKIKTVWASIVPQTGTMGKRVGTEFAAMTHKLIVRYAAGKDILTKYHFKYSGRRYDILYPLNPYESNINFEFYCKEVIE